MASVPLNWSPQSGRAKRALTATRTMVSAAGLASFGGELRPKKEVEDSQNDEEAFDMEGGE